MRGEVRVLARKNLVVLLCTARRRSSGSHRSAHRYLVRILSALEGFKSSQSRVERIRTIRSFEFSLPLKGSRNWPMTRGTDLKTRDLRGNNHGSRPQLDQPCFDEVMVVNLNVFGNNTGVVRPCLGVVVNIVVFAVITTAFWNFC